MKRRERFLWIILAVTVSLLLPGAQSGVFAAEEMNSSGRSHLLFEDGEELDDELDDEELIVDFSTEDEVRAKGQFDFGEEEGYAIVPMCAGGKCVDADGSKSNKEIQIWELRRNKNQTWMLQRNGEYYSIQLMNNSNYLEVKDGKTANKAELTTAPYTGEDKQLWIIEDSGTGTYSIKSKLDPDYVVTVNEFSYDNGTKVLLQKQRYGYDQQFRFVHITTTEPMNEWGASRLNCYGSDWDVWDGSVDTSWYYADQNKRVYEISKASQLAGIAQIVNDGVTRFYGRAFILTTDIDLSGLAWTRIGVSDCPFEANFDGRGHVIKGLSMTNGDTDNTGFFGYVNGSCISNLAIKGYVTGDENVGGLVGKMTRGYIADVYSEVSVVRAGDDNMAGICGRMEAGGGIEHCTQNALVSSNNKEPTRAGIAGYSAGMIRYCVNLSEVYCNWNYVGGIVGECVGSCVEYCANYGTVGGANDAERVGGICGRCRGNGLVFACFNSGNVTSTGDDYIGGICGKQEGDGHIDCCINTGDVKGHKQVGGIIGEGSCSYCFNAGSVDGDDDVGAVGGKASELNWSRALEKTCGRLNGDSDDSGAYFVTADDMMSGKLCHDLNRWYWVPQLGGGKYGLGWDMIFFQNIGADKYPTFTGQAVWESSNQYSNEAFEVRVEYSKGGGTVTGGGVYHEGPVVLQAYPAAGYLFDRFEVVEYSVKTSRIAGMNIKYVDEQVAKYETPQLTLTDNITKSYTVRAVFRSVNAPEEGVKQTVKIELECTDDADGWNRSVIPVVLETTSGEEYSWDVPRKDLDGKGKKVSHTFEISDTLPIGIRAWPDFGGGATRRNFGMKARMWLNGSKTPLETKSQTIDSFLFTSSVHGGSSLYLTFGDLGESTVGILKEDGTLQEKGKYHSCSEAWKAALKLGKGAAIRLESGWLLKEKLSTGSSEITLDLNGYPIYRVTWQSGYDGEVVCVNSKGTMHIIDSASKGKSDGASMTGGSLQGGRNENGGGLIQCEGTLDMKGGLLLNGRTTDYGSAVHCEGGTAYLEDVKIINCRTYEKPNATIINGGAIAVSEGGNATFKNCSISGCSSESVGGAVFTDGKESVLTLIDTTISGCSSTKGPGGAVYQYGGSIRMTGGSIRNCKSIQSGAGAIYQDFGNLRCENVILEANNAEKSGGAVYVDSTDPAWFIGCTFLSNVTKGKGGAIFHRDNSGATQDYALLYLENCTVNANSSLGAGGGLFIGKPSSVDLRGVTVIRNNDGAGQLDNLVLEPGAYIYDLGLNEGSEVHLCSTKDGEVRLSSDSHFISEYQMGTYLISDKTGLKLSDPKNVHLQLQASATSEGRVALIIGAVLFTAGVVILIVVVRKRRKGAKS